MKINQLFIIIFLSLFSIGTFGQDENYKVTNIKALNSVNLDFAPVPHRDGLVFTSTRRAGSLFSCPENVGNDNFSDLWFAQKDPSGGFFEPIMLEKKLKGKYHDGAATFNHEDTKMYFSRNNQQGTNEKNVIDLKIYEATLSNDLWGDIKEVNFNSNEFATCHPTLTMDGQQLFFASNRPGGFGGMDIWVATWNGLGWGEPVNLGEKVNSTRNEIFPFIDEEETLVFASDGWGGFGGLDLFSVTNNDNIWGKRIHLEAPLNSKSDDFGYAAEPGGLIGYFSSNRKGGNGKDDLYQWEFLGEKPILATVCVIDAKDETRILDAQLAVSKHVNLSSNSLRAGDLPSNKQLEKRVIDGVNYYVFRTKDITEMADPFSRIEENKSCSVEVPVVPEKTYEISVSKPGYASKIIQVTGADMLAAPEYLIPINPKSTMKMLAGLVYNLQTGDPIPFSNVQILNTCTNEQSEVKTDHRGKFQLEINCDCGYEMTGRKETFEAGEKRLLAFQNDCEQDIAEVDIPLEPMTKPEVAPVVDKTNFKVGQIIQLDKLYYDFNKYYIREDASVELEKVVDLLQKYPSMEIELSSHTDSRGSDSYNEKLSSNRAKSAVEYIISRGVSARRVVAKGYGEYQLVNRCKNNVKCTEEEHQANRRTEIKVTAFNEEGVKLKE